MEELQSNRVQEDVISRTESKVKELENTLRTEERSVMCLFLVKEHVVLEAFLSMLHIIQVLVTPVGLDYLDL